MVVEDLEILGGERAEKYNYDVGEKDRVDDPVEGVGGRMRNVEAHLPRGPEDADDQHEGDEHVPELLPRVFWVNYACLLYFPFGHPL